MSEDDDCVIVEDNTNYKSVSCENIPELFLDKLTAKKHFSKFGKIHKFILRPKRFSCTVEYEREAEAENAYQNAGVFNGQHFAVEFTVSEDSHVQNTEEWVDADVQAELEAMGTIGGGSSSSNAVRKMPLVQMPRIARPVVVPKLRPPDGGSNSREAPPKIDYAMKQELEAILKRPAANDEEKYRILDARDKLIRLTTIRQTDYKKAVSAKGTCPDMCPEKERLMRESQHQVAWFELESGLRNVMNHKNAVKEYSRSSADQEVPLAHELRSEDILKMTMTYLLHRIMDLCDDPDVNVGDWFHFLWDRTRSIRKDITQQELCSLNAVELVEQCARFHIHCAARLISEDPCVFDQKINTENLTKCLQTLKYMYHDLRLKNIACPHEAEFRAYVILLNLNDGNFLWEVRQLPDDVQQSPEIRDAIGFYLSMESNNYVKFFQRVQRTTYMNACILLRYFTQIRLKALMTMIKAFQWRHVVSIPMAYMTKVLGFESVESAASLFGFYGLECDDERVALDKNTFFVPDMPYQMDRSMELVESKRWGSVGESVCGRKLDPSSIFENHIPHDSFDADGYLRPESWSAEDQLRGENAPKRQEKPAAAPQPPPTISTRQADNNIFKVPMSTPPKPFIQPSTQNSSPFGDALSSSTPNSIGASIFGKSNAAPLPFFQSALKPNPNPTASSSSIFGNASNSKNTAESIFGSIKFKKPTEPEIQNVFKDDNIFKNFESTPISNFTFGGISQKEENNTHQGFSFMENAAPKRDLDAEIREAQRKQEEDRIRKLRIEEEAKRKRLEAEKLKLQQMKKDLEEQQRQQQTKLNAEKEKQRQKQIEHIVQSSEITLNEILKTVQLEEISEIAKSEMKKFKKIITQSERMTEDIFIEVVAEYILKISKQEIEKLHKNQNVLVKYFQIWRETAQRKIEHRKLIEATPSWAVPLSLDEQAAKLAHPSQDETLQLMKRYRLGVPFDLKNISTLKTDPPINIFSVLSKHFSPNMSRGLLKVRKFYKLLISLPGERDELDGFNSYLTSWLEKNIKRGENNPSEFICRTEDNLSLCVRTVSGIVPQNEQKQRVTSECDHADGMVFMMTCKNFLNSRKRLHHLLKLSKNFQQLPIAIVVYNSTVMEEAIESALELGSLIEDNKIAVFNIFGSSECIREHNLHSTIVHSLQFVAKHNRLESELEMQSLTSLLNQTLGDEMWRRWHESWMINPSFRKLATIPTFVVNLYNETVDRLITVVDEDFQDSPELASEMRQFVPQVSIDIPLSLEYFPLNWKSADRAVAIKIFLNAIKLHEMSGEHHPTDVEELELWILDYAQKCIPSDQELGEKIGYAAIKCILERLNQPDLIDLPILQRLDLISWLSIIKQISLGVLNYTWSKMHNNLPQEVIYERSTLQANFAHPWWLESETIKSVKMLPPPTPPSSKADVTPSTPTNNPDMDIDDVLAKGYAALSKADKKIKRLLDLSTTCTQIEPTSELDQSLYQFEVNRIIRTLDDPVLSPPSPKKIRLAEEDNIADDIDSIMARANSIINKVEKRMEMRYFEL